MASIGSWIFLVVAIVVFVGAIVLFVRMFFPSAKEVESGRVFFDQEKRICKISGERCALESTCLVCGSCTVASRIVDLKKEHDNDEQ